MKRSNVVQEKSFDFAVRMINFYKYLMKEKKGNEVLARQILKSGTSIGANTEEAIGGQTKNDFYAKIAIAYKEARETKYWLRLFCECNIIENVMLESLLEDCEELLKILGSIKKSQYQANS